MLIFQFPTLLHFETNSTFVILASAVKNQAHILTLACFGVILVSMFLPFYETLHPRASLSANDFTVMKVTAFSDTHSVVEFNGFGSMFALINLPVAGLLVLARFYFPASPVTAISGILVFVVSMALLIYQNEASAVTRYENEMLSGFYLMLICEVILITQAFTGIVSAPDKNRRHRPDNDILDL